MHPVAERRSTSRWRPSGAAVALQLLVGLLLVDLLLVAPPAAHADPGGGVELVLSGLDAVLGPGTAAGTDDTSPAEVGERPLGLRVLVGNDGDAALDAVSLVVEVHAPVTTRPELREALDGDGPRDPGRVVLDVELEDVAPGGVAQRALEVPTARGGWADGSAPVAVHPVLVSVLRGSEVLDQVRTAVVWVARVPDDPLALTAVLPITAPPAPAPGTVGLATAVRPGGLVDRLVRTGASAPAGTFALAADAAVLEDLAGAAEGGVAGAEELRAELVALAAAQPVGPVSQAYAAADLGALAGTTGTSDLASLAVAEGRLRLRTQLGRAPSSVHLATSPLTPAALDLLPTEVLVTRSDALAGPVLDADPVQPSPVRSTMTPSGRPLTVLVGDPWVTALLDDADGHHGWPAAAHRVLLETAVAQLEAGAPPAADGTVPSDALVVVPPQGWAAPGDLGPELARGLAAAPWLDVVAPDAMAAAVARGVRPPWVAVPPEQAGPSLLLRRVAAARRRLAGLASATTPVLDEPAPQAPPEQVDAVDLRRATDALLRATSTWPRARRDAEALARVETVRADVDAALGSVEVPIDAAVTLTSERGTVPVTVRHDDGVPLQALVEVTAQGSLNFLDGTTRAVELVPGESATVAFEAAALGRGTFPVVVRVTTPDGQVLLGDREVISVRTTAVSQPALLTVVGVVVVLLLLGGRRRRRDPPPLALVDDER